MDNRAITIMTVATVAFLLFYLGVIFFITGCRVEPRTQEQQQEWFNERAKGIVCSEWSDLCLCMGRAKLGAFAFIAPPDVCGDDKFKRVCSDVWWNRRGSDFADTGAPASALTKIEETSVNSTRLKWERRH